MNPESIDFQEIFGASTVRESLDAVAPVVVRESKAAQLPMDTDPFWLENLPSESSTERIEDAEFIKTICGEPPVLATGTVRPTTYAGYFAKRDNARRDSLAKRAPRRRRELATIIDRWADHTGIDTIDGVGELLDKVKESAAAYVNEILLEVAA